MATEAADWDSTVVEVALNGGRLREEHPLISWTPAEVDAYVAACFAAGATVAHAHVARPRPRTERSV